MAKSQTNIFIAIAVLGSLLLSVCAPLLTYSSTIALFGITHVLCELRYVDQRFGHDIKQRFAMGLGTLLTGVVIFRLLVIAKIVPAWRVTTFEVILVFFIAVYSATLLHDKKESPWLAILVASLLLTGWLISPTGTLLILAFLHNLTPIGFIIEGVPSSFRQSVTYLCLLVFILIPLFILSGWPHILLKNWLGVWPDASFLSTGPLASQLGVYLPAAIRDTSWAIDAFSAASFAQCMHYVSVIHVLPRIQLRFQKPDTKTTWLSWPTPQKFLLLVAGASALFSLSFFWDFQTARSFYGIFAALHAWVEIPLLMLAFAAIKSSSKAKVPAESILYSPATKPAAL